MPSVGADGGALVVTGLSKRFGATLAAQQIDLSLRPGTVHALLGGNGSGKSTVVKMLAGVLRADSGTVERFGRRCTAESLTPADAHELGLRFVHQSLGLFDDLSVAENFALGMGYPMRSGRVDWRAVRSSAAELIERFGIGVHPDTEVRRLRPATRAVVALARALADEHGDDHDDSGTVSSHLLVVDEATAALPRGESAEFLQVLRTLAGRGRGSLFISHRIQEVLDVADEITVLRDGQVVARRSTESLARSDLVDLLSGHPVAEEHAEVHAPQPQGGERLKVSGLSAGPLRRVDLTAASGEIVGLSGLLGSGRTTVLEAIFGVRPIRAGTIYVDGRSLRRSTSAAIAAGVALVPEDRARQATFATRTVGDNLTETVVRRCWRRGWLSHRRARSEARALVSDYAIVAPGEHVAIATLSGGNQQKVVLARWLTRRPSVLLLDEPTQGVDLTSRATIHELVRESARTGSTVLLVSSDLDELLTLSSRIIVLADGQLVGERIAPFNRADLLSLEQLTLAASLPDALSPPPNQQRNEE